MLCVAESFALTDTGRARRANEDSLFERAPVFAVADGMGGAQAGEVASSVAVEGFEQGMPADGTPEERLAALAHEANERIHALSRADEQRAGMGTTLTAAYVDGDVVSFVHVGDSRAYLFRDGKLERLTEDHSLVGEMVRRGKLTEEEAEGHPQRSIITRALGPEPAVEVDTMSKYARAGDVFVLCSDGLTTMISEDRVEGILLEAGSLREAGERMVDEANQAGGRDNITVVLFSLRDGGDGDDVSEHDTVVGARAVSQAEVDAATRGGGATTAMAAAPAAAEAGAGAPVAERRPRRPSLPPPDRPRRPLRSRIPFALIAALVVLAVVGVGGWIATRAVFFVGSNDQGVVTVYRGLPYELPAGIKLYSAYYASSVPAGDVPAARRRTLLDHTLRSREDATDLVKQLELGELGT